MKCDIVPKLSRPAASSTQPARKDKAMAYFIPPLSTYFRVMIAMTAVGPTVTCRIDPKRA